MTEEHVHQGNIHSSNGKLVCPQCDDHKGTNECFCECHSQGKDVCTNCMRFHRSD